MDLQTIFYALGIICMSMTLFILIAIVVLLFYMEKKITEIAETINQKIESFITPAEVAVEMGTAAVKKVKSMIKG